jgi:hypothetical protein
MMPELWFVLGMAVGVAVAGFTAIGSFGRGEDSVRRRSWVFEHSARKRAYLLSRPAGVRRMQPSIGEVVPKAS